MFWSPQLPDFTPCLVGWLPIVGLITGLLALGDWLKWRRTAEKQARAAAGSWVAISGASLFFLEFVNGNAQRLLDWLNTPAVELVTDGLWQLFWIVVGGAAAIAAAIYMGHQINLFRRESRHAEKPKRKEKEKATEAPWKNYTMGPDGELIPTEEGIKNGKVGIDYGRSRAEAEEAVKAEFQAREARRNAYGVIEQPEQPSPITKIETGSDGEIIREEQKS